MNIRQLFRIDGDGSDPSNENEGPSGETVE